MSPTSLLPALEHLRASRLVVGVPRVESPPRASRWAWIAVAVVGSGVMTASARAETPSDTLDLGAWFKASPLQGPFELSAAGSESVVGKTYSDVAKKTGVPAGANPGGAAAKLTGTFTLTNQLKRASDAAMLGSIIYVGHIQGTGTAHSTTFDASRGLPPDTRTVPCSGPFGGDLQLELRFKNYDAQLVRPTLRVEYSAAMDCGGGVRVGVSGANHLDASMRAAVVPAPRKPDALQVRIPVYAQIGASTPGGGDIVLGEGTLTLGSNALEAVPTLPASVERGAALDLDGTRSTGAVTDYLWTFEPVGGGPALPDGAAQKRGPTAQVVLLDSVKVTLTVTDGRARSSKSATVLVVPRSDFRTAFTEEPAEGIMRDSLAPIFSPVGSGPSGRRLSGAWLGGENVCSVDPDAALHVLHIEPGATGAYLVEPVVDPQGPFHGVFFFRKWKARVTRSVRIDRYILPDGPPALAGIANFYQGNAARGRDVAGYLAAVREHEHRHSQLMREALEADDPARAMERRYGADSEGLRREADARIAAAEKRIREHSKDPLPQTWSKELFVPVIDTGAWSPATVTVGGPQYGTP